MYVNQGIIEDTKTVRYVSRNLETPYLLKLHSAVEDDSICQLMVVCSIPCCDKTKQYSVSSIPKRWQYVMDTGLNSGSEHWS